MPVYQSGKKWCGQCGEARDGNLTRCPEPNCNAILRKGSKLSRLKKKVYID